MCTHVSDDERNPANWPKNKIEKTAIHNRSAIRLIICPSHMLLLAVGAILHERLPEDI